MQLYSVLEFLYSQLPRALLNGGAGGVVDLVTPVGDLQ